MIDDLRKQYYKATGDLIPLLPTLIAMLDFSRTNDFKTVSARMKSGLYGTVVDNQYIAPLSGPYVGFMKDITEEEMKRFRELMGVDDKA